jgi:cell division protein FtsW
MVLLFIGRVPVRFLASLILIGAVVGFTALKVGQRGETFFSRIESFLDKSEVPFQAQQSYIAVSTGGVMGKGPGKSDQKNFLPHPYSDFIFAIIVEEYGMLGGFAVLILYLVLLYRGMLTAQRIQGTFAGLLSAGLSFSVVMQALVHMGVVVGLFPITGLPLPMLSMGGTSLLFTGIAIGILISVSRGKGEVQPTPAPETGNAYQASAF